MTDVKAIFKGHVNEVFGVNQQLFNERRAICQVCPEMQTMSYGEVCGLCGCRLQAKLRLPTEICPNELWLPVAKTNI